MNLDASALAIIRELLDETMYALVDFRLSFEVELAPTGFPRFSALQAALPRLHPAQETVFRLFRLGEPVGDARVREALPGRALEAFAAVGLIERSDDTWRTPSLLIVPIEGLYLMVGVPPSYPTWTGATRTWMDLSTYVAIRALPTTLVGERVLDLCSGSGVLALVCARRGATRAIGLEIDESAVELATANAVLNGVPDRVEFRRSDGLAALAGDETFDFAVCNTPYAPVIDDGAAPPSLATIGNAVLLRSLEQLPRHLAPRAAGVLASWRAAGHRGSTYQLELISKSLGSAGCAVTAYVDRAPDTVESVTKTMLANAEARGLPASRGEAARDLLAHPPQPFDGFYNQLIAFRRGRDAGAPGAVRRFAIAPPIEAPRS
jgi:SAM-dependent methyltransferase